ncbi:MAG: YHS domain-containing protein [Desulfobacterales bacterium]|nr:MAG: YHS domain-containing protein [Desulfobacterales bacterium]
MNSSASTTKAFIDPVCGMAVDPGKAAGVATIQGETYYFCAEACRKSFENDPQKYLEPQPARRKSLWCRYMERLQKATGGKPMKCH